MGLPAFDSASRAESKGASWNTIGPPQKWQNWSKRWKTLLLSTIFSFGLPLSEIYCMCLFIGWFSRVNFSWGIEWCTLEVGRTTAKGSKLLQKVKNTIFSTMVFSFACPWVYDIAWDFSRGGFLGSKFCAESNGAYKKSIGPRESCENRVRRSKNGKIFGFFIDFCPLEPRQNAGGVNYEFLLVADSFTKNFPFRLLISVKNSRSYT